MKTTYIEHNGKQYEVKEPTIETWKNVMVFKDLFDEEEMNLKMISEVTGLSMKEIKQADALDIRIAGDTLWRYLNQESRELFRSIEHNGITYTLVDVNKISFGQFVDIDTFLKKDESYRISNLNELMAYMYCEEGTKYSESNFKKRIEIMLDAPSHIIESSLFFLSSLEKGLYELMELSSKSPLMFQLMKLKIVFHRFGDTTRLFRFLLKTKFGRLILSLIWVLLLPLIICHILLTSIMRGKG